MNVKPFGTLLNRPVPEIVLKPGDPGHMGEDLSPETKRAIEEIEANIRNACANARYIICN